LTAPKNENDDGHRHGDNNQQVSDSVDDLLKVAGVIGNRDEVCGSSDVGVDTSLCRKIIRRVVKKTAGVDREVTKTVSPRRQSKADYLSQKDVPAKLGKLAYPVCF
jgi:hypothetical protein